LQLQKKILESLRFEKTSKIMKSKCQPATTEIQFWLGVLLKVMVMLIIGLL